MDGDGRLELTTSCQSQTVAAVWEITAFNSEGSLTGSIVERGNLASWAEIVVEAEQPGGDTSVDLELRAGDDPDDLGPFIPIVGLAADLSDYIDEFANFLQYQLIITSQDEDRSPHVHAVQVSSALGDVDGDGDVDLLDFASFLDCVTGPMGGVELGCESADLDNDQDVDRSDFAVFQLVFPGTG